MKNKPKRHKESNTFKVSNMDVKRGYVSSTVRFVGM
jgi:hypothetical protein